MAGLDLVRLVVGAAFLGAAAASDFRERRVKDELWIGMGILGIALFAGDLWAQAAPVPVWLVLVPTVILLFDPLVDTLLRKERGREETKGFPLGSVAAYVLALGTTAYALWVSLGNPSAFAAFVRYLTVPVMMVAFRVMYELRLLLGGADAKALIAIAALVPQYPDLPPFPLLAVEPRLMEALRVLFPFSLLVVLDAALLFLAVPAVFLAYNVRRGHTEFPMAVLGYKVALDRVPTHAWFMEQIIDGEHVFTYFPRRKQDRTAIVRGLRETGLREAWVTPQLPFMVPLAAGYVLAFVLGNPLMGLLQGLT